MESVKNIKNILMRIVAVFAANGLAVIGAGAIAGISTAKAITVAGLTAVAAVIEKLARAFMDDGKLTADEINAAFSTVDKGAKTVADVEVEQRIASDKVKARKAQKWYTDTMKNYKVKLEIDAEIEAFNIDDATDYVKDIFGVDDEIKNVNLISIKEK